MTSDRLPSGAAKARWLADFVSTRWQALGRPCDQATAGLAVRYAEERAARSSSEGTVLVHGDAHADNLLQAPGSFGAAGDFRLIDPEGLASEPAHDLGVLLRGWNDGLFARDATTIALERHCLVSDQTGVDPAPIWQWSFLERVSRGLLLLSLGHDEEARAFLEVADRLTEAHLPWE